MQFLNGRTLQWVAILAVVACVMGVLTSVSMKCNATAPTAATCFTWTAEHAWRTPAFYRFQIRVTGAGADYTGELAMLDQWDKPVHKTHNGKLSTEQYADFINGLEEHGIRSLHSDRILGQM